MKIITLSIALFGLMVAITTGNASAADEGVKPMKQFASIEQIRCPKARYHSVKKRLECKHEVRAELNAKLNQREAKNDEAQ